MYGGWLEALVPSDKYPVLPDMEDQEARYFANYAERQEKTGGGRVATMLERFGSTAQRDAAAREVMGAFPNVSGPEPDKVRAREVMGDNPQWLDLRRRAQEAARQAMSAR
jgi:hypothetical protein